MFCMNCGQQLPDGAKFCMTCGTPQGSVSPANHSSDPIKINDHHTFVPAMCPNCNAHMKVDSSSKTARCEACGTECLVQEAINNLSIRGNVQVNNATINVNGSNTESLLKRVEIMLLDGDFKNALNKCDTILDSDPTNGEVYLYMLMANLGCRKRCDLAHQHFPFDRNQYYIKAQQYGNNELKTELNRYIVEIMLKRGDYEGAMSLCNSLLSIDSTNANTYVYMLMADLRCSERSDIELYRGNLDENPFFIKAVQYGDDALINELNGYLAASKMDIPENLQTGDELRFGTNADGDRIWWKALFVNEDHQALIFCNDVICDMPYHQYGGDITWHDCTLRQWLNNDFVDEYFTPSEAKRIIPCDLDVDYNPDYRVSSGMSSTDKVFLLSINEVMKFYDNAESLSCGSWWWLRSPGSKPSRAADVSNDGSMSTLGLSVDIDHGVRPAMWIKTD